MAIASIKEEDRVFLIDGVVTSDKNVVTCAGYAAAPEAASSRIYVNFGDWWGAHDVPEDFIVSVAYRDGELFALGKNGLVKTVGQHGQNFARETVAGKFRSFVIDPCEGLGHLTKVRATRFGFVACGWGGQLYRLSVDGWSSLTTDDQAFADYDLLDIDATSSGHLYAVGLGGAVLYFDGQSWHVEDMSTNRHFYAVRCFPNGTVLLAGAKGAIYWGCHDQWQEFDSEVDGNFWSIEVFGGAAYLAYADRQLYRLAQGKLDEISYGFTAHTYRLSAGPSILLSIGSDALLRYDGMSWTKLQLSRLGLNRGHTQLRMAYCKALGVTARSCIVPFGVAA